MKYEALLTPPQLAERWYCSIEKLDADRPRGGSCPDIKLNQLARYHAVNVERSESQHLRNNTNEEATYE